MGLVKRGDTAVRKASESQEQIMYFDWVRMMANSDPRFKMIYAVANHNYFPSSTNAKSRYALINRLLKEGVTSGVLDINVDVPQEYLGTWRPGMKIEMKVKYNTLRKNQAAFMATAQQFGYLCHVCYSGEAAIDRTKEYFGI